VFEITVILPCLNEVCTIAACVRYAQCGISGFGVSGEMVVVANNSDDNSADLARAAGSRMVASPKRGYGSALRTGIAAANAPVGPTGDDFCADCSQGECPIG